MGALRHLPDTTCEHCRTVFRPRRAEQQFCSRDCWYKKAGGSSERVCRVCGKAFKAKYAQQTYCSVPCKNTAITKDKTCICAVCGKNFERPHGKTRAYCSRSCANKARADGMKMPTITLDARVVGDTVKSTSGYLMVRMNGKKVMQHRLVMEQVIGRPLTPGERVHHRNGKRDDNRPENLELWTGVGSSKKDPHGVRLLDKVLDMIESLTEQEQMKVRQRLEELTS